MKNFSAKTANFQNLKVKDANVISEINLGTAPNQIPLNKDLGSLAYQDAVNLDDVSADMVELRAIAAEISDSAVDVFVYDTSRDSDGGAWRKRTQHTSWYNEELNTAARGARREFPAVAVIVAEADKVTIYDGDDPDLSMWMVINQIEWSSAVFFRDISCINATMVIGSGSGITVVNFINERLSKIHSSTIYTGDYEWGKLLYNPPTLVDYGLIEHNHVNDVAMTVLPNAPIDDDTGLPVPTIAVATDGGVSVIRDDGTVVDITKGAYSATHVAFDKNNKLLLCANSGTDEWHSPSIFEIPFSDISLDDNLIKINPYHASTHNDAKRLGALSDLITELTSRASGNTHGMTNFEPNYSEREKTLSNFITSKYNTGWMPGDIKLAALSDSVVETVGVNSDNLLGGNNSSFTSGIGDWVDISIGSESVVRNTSGNYVELTRVDGNNNARIGIGLNLQADQMYVLKFYLVDSSSSGVQVRGFKSSDNSFSTNQIINSTASQDGLYTVSFRAEDGYDGIMFIPISGTNTVANLDSVTIRATTELITNGDFSTDSDWTKGTGWTISGGVASNDGSATTDSFLSQEVYVEAGKRYALTAKCTARTAGIFSLTYDFLNLSGSAANVTIGSSTNIYAQGDSAYREFLADTSGYLRIIINSSSGSAEGSIDNVSMLPFGDEDRSVNDNGLQIVGEINKTPVAPGADLVAYSGFSADDYLMQPYNSDLDFGTGDFCVMGWAKNSDSSSTYKTLLYRNTADISGSDLGTNNGNSGWQVMLNTLGQLYCHVYGDGNNFAGIGVNSGFSLTDGSWHQFAVTYTGGVTKIFIDGIMKNSISVDHGNFDNSQAILSVGSRPVTSLNFEFTGSLALTRVGKTAPTDAQIAKIYRDEKALFTDGAQATLYGTSDAVTALAYDDKTELLYVGTSSGRSDFAGLRRINNTTTAVTTSISASNNLIAEQ